MVGSDSLPTFDWVILIVTRVCVLRLMPSVPDIGSPLYPGFCSKWFSCEYLCFLCVLHLFSLSYQWCCVLATTVYMHSSCYDCVSRKIQPGATQVAESASLRWVHPRTRQFSNLKVISYYVLLFNTFCIITFLYLLLNMMTCSFPTIFHGEL